MRIRIVGCLFLALVMIPSAASAKFGSSASGSPTASAAAVNAGNAPSATAVGTTVNLSWTASTLSTGAYVTGYVIKRYDSTGTVAQTIASGSCSVIASQTTCNETSVPDGTWRYSVTPAHNDWRGAESAKTSVTVDVTAPPAPTITAKPPNPSTSPNASFSFTDTEAGVTFECRIDSGAYAACTGSKSYTGLATGSHTFVVRALDGAGNPSTASTYTWTVQSCSQVSISNFAFTPASVTIPTGCSVTWTQTSGTKHDTTSDTGVWASGQMNSGQTFTYQFPSPGTYPYKCTIHPSMTGTITVDSTSDTTPPTAALTFPAPGSSHNNGGWDAGCGSGFCGTASDGAGSGVNQVRVSIQQGNGNYWNGSSFGSASEVLLNATGTSNWSYAFAGANFPTEGTYTIRATATDNASNASTAVSSTFTIDRTAPPAPTITANPPNPSTSPNASFSFTDTEAGVSFECRIDSGAYAACTGSKSYTGLATGSHTFVVRALDGAGNPSTAAIYTWTVQSCAQVSMVGGNAFSPSAVTVAVGCSVLWTNTVNNLHSTTSATGIWDSGNLGNGQSFTWQFNSTGSFPYLCLRHAGMTGTITVN